MRISDFWNKSFHIVDMAVSVDADDMGSEADCAFARGKFDSIVHGCDFINPESQ